MLPIECVVRGYLSGSGWKDYRATGAVCGHTLPPDLASRTGCPSRSSRRRRRRSPGTTRTSTVRPRLALVGTERFDEVERAALALYALAADYALERGIILADTKLEFGLDEDGVLVLGDEAFTPDSSRFWPADEYAPGGTPPSYDKQFVRDYCETVGWDKTPPGPELPDDVVEGTRARYVEAFERLTGIAFDDVPRRSGDRARMRATVLVRPKPGILDPQGQAVASALHHLGFDVGDARVGRLVELDLPTDDRTQALHRAGADVRAAPHEPSDRELRDRTRRRPVDATRTRRAHDRHRTPRPSSRSSSSRGRTTIATRSSRWSGSARDSARVWHTDVRASRAGRRPSSSRAGSRTATTSAAERSHGSRRSCVPSWSSLRTADSFSESATASRC